MRLAVYARQSKTDAKGVPSTTWQTAAAEKWAAERGHEVVARFADVDSSGYRRVARPGFDQLLEAVSSGAVDGTLVWRLDRLSRQGQWGRDVLRFMDARGDTALLSVEEDVDTTTAAGELILGVRLSMARGESEAISSRWREQKARAYAAGLPPSGGHRWFGWTRDFKIEPAEADMIRGAAAAVAAGGSLRAVVLDWNRQGVPTSTGRRWSTASLRQMLTSPRLAGLRADLTPGAWPAILDQQTSMAVRAVLLDPSRRRGTPATSLLGGLVRCGRCGTRMRAGSNVRGTPRYACPAPPDGCSGVTVVAAPLEEDVEHRLIARLSRLKLPERTVDTAALLQRLGADELALAEVAADFYTDRILTRAQFLAASERLSQRIAATRREINEAETAPAGSPADAVDAYLAGGVDVRRAIWKLYSEQVLVKPAVRGRNFYDPNRVVVSWK